MSFGEKLKELRLNQRFSQAELGKVIGVHEKHVTKMETTNHLPSAETLVQIATTFNVSVDYLLFDDVPKNIELAHLSDPNLADLIFQADSLSEDDRKVIKETVNALLTRAKVQSIFLTPKRAPKKSKTA